MPVGLISILKQSSHSGHAEEIKKEHFEAASRAKALSIERSRRLGLALVCVCTLAHTSLDTKLLCIMAKVLKLTCNA